MAVSTIVEAIVKDEHAILPVSHVLGDTYGNWSGIAFSLPCRVGREGIEQTFLVPLSEEEQKSLDQSAELLKEFYSQVKEA